MRMFSKWWDGDVKLSDSSEKLEKLVSDSGRLSVEEKVQT